MHGFMRALVFSLTAAALGGTLVQPGGAIQSIVADPQREVFYVALDTDELAKIDVSSAQVVARVAVPGAPGVMAVEPDGSRLYAGLTASHDVAIVDLASFALVGTVDLSSTDTFYRGGMALGRPGRLYVIWDDGISVVDTSGSGTELYFGDAGAWEYRGGAAAVRSDGKRLYIADQGTSPGSMIVFNIETDCPLYVGEDGCHGCVGSGGAEVRVPTNGSRVYLAAYNPDEVQVLSDDGGLLRHSHRILTEGLGPDSVVLSRLNDRIYSGSSSLYFYISDATSLLTWHREPLREYLAAKGPNLALSASERIVGAVVETTILAGEFVELVDVSAMTPTLGGLRFRPVDAVTGVPVSGASGSLGSFSDSAYIDVDNGVVGVAPEDPGSYTAEIDAPGYQTRSIPVTIVAGQWTDLGAVNLTSTGGHAPPEEVVVIPTLSPGATMDVVVRGQGFMNGGQFDVVGRTGTLTVNTFAFRNWTTIDANVTVDASVREGGRVLALSVTNSDGLSASGYAAVGAVGIVLSPSTMPGGTLGVAYNQSLTASGGTGPYTFSVTSGALPVGLSLSSAGAISGTPTLAAAFGFTVMATDAGGGGCGGSQDYVVVIGGGTGVAGELLAGAGLGSANPNRVRALEQDGSATSTDFLAYAAGQWGVNVAGASVATGQDQILTGPGPGAQFGPQVRGFLASGSAMGKINYYAYGTLKYGVNVAAGDVEDDGFEEIVTGAGPGDVFGPHVRGWNFDGAAVAAVGKINFFSYGTLKYGVNPAAGDVDGDSSSELGTGPGPGFIFGPQVRGFNYDGQALSAIAKINFNAFSTTQYGVNLAIGDGDGDPFTELACAPGPGAGASFQAHMLGFNYDATVIAALAGYDVTLSMGTVYGGRIALGDVTGDGSGDLLGAAGRDPAASARIHPFHYTGSFLVPLVEVDAFPGLGYGANPSSGLLGL